MELAIEIRDVNKSFSSGLGARPGRQILNQIEVEVPRGRSVAVLGPNGAGKTTLLKMILGLLFVDSGNIRILGHEPGSFEAREAIGFLSELPMTYDYLNRQTFLDFFSGMQNGNVDPSLEKLVKELVDEIPQDLKMGDYSKGMMQRLNFARVLMKNPEIVFLDEPATGLDPIGQLRILRIANALRELGRTLWVNTHSIEFALKTADEILVLHQGRIAGRFLSEEHSREEIESLFLSLESLRS